MTSKATIDVQQLIREMTVEEKVGQISIPVFQSGDVTPEIEKAIVQMGAGMIRFSPNAEYDNKSEPIGAPNPCLTPRQTADLTNRLQGLARQTRLKIPLSINVDQEGGIETDVNRGGITIFPSQMGLSAMHDPALTRAAGQVIGSEMRAMGLTLNQTPSLDVIKGTGYKAVKTLTFGDRRDVVVAQATAFVKGLKAGGAAVMLKHFPSYGSSSQDAHDDLPVISKSKQELIQDDIVIYQKCIESGADAIMVGHVVTPCLDDSGTPATLSRPTVTGFLKGEMNFRGMVQTDAMRMRAILNHYGLERASIMAVQAGNDAVLLRGDMAFYEEGYRAILDACKKGKITEDRLNDAVKRILELKSRLGLFQRPIVDLALADRTVGSPKNRAISRRVAAKSVTLLRNRNRILPLKLKYTDRLLVITTLAKKLTATNDPIQSPDMLLRAIRERHANTVGLDTPMVPAEGDWTRCQEHGRRADAIILATANAIVNEAQVQLARQLLSLGKPLVLVAMQSPHDLLAYPEVDACVATYELSNDSMIVVGGILFGKQKPVGKIPLKNSLGSEKNG